MNIYIKGEKKDKTLSVEFHTENDNNAFQVLFVLEQAFRKLKAGIDEVYLTEGQEAATNCTIERVQGSLTSKNN